MASKITVCLLLAYFVTAATSAGSSFIIHVNASNISSKTIWNPWSTENSADYTHQWLNQAAINKSVPINEQYPFLSRQKFAYSTGGCYKGYKDNNNKTCKTTFDLLQDPSDPNSPYNFTLLHTAINNVIKLGLKPYIVTGLIPIAYSINATLSDAKNLNELPPNYSYEKYGEYIYNLAKYFRNHYNESEIKTWLFGVITEFNNYHHFQDINDINKTEAEYFKVYDYTECNLKKGFESSDNFIMGAHSCRNCARKFSWNPDDLLNHIANEKNYCTGIKGETKMDFYSSSFYEHAPGAPGDQSMFDTYICSMHQAVAKYNLTDQIKDIAIDEGRIIGDQYGIQMAHRATGHTYQASWDSLLFINMIRCNISRFTRWDINTNGIGIYTDTDSKYVETIDPVSANVVKLTYKMTGNSILSMVVMENHDVGYEDDANNTQIVNGLASISNGEDPIIRVFIFNHNSQLFSTQTANTSVYICDVTRYGNSDYCEVTEWLIDDNNSQYYNIYWNDIIENNITSFCGYPVWSNQSEEICLTNQADHDYIQTRTPLYQNASKLVSKKYQIEYKANDCIEITRQVIPSHGVRLFEVSC